MLDGRWVTVFGFPVGLEDVVERHFQQFGTIIDHVYSHSNWMHIQYVQVVVCVCVCVYVCLVLVFFCVCGQQRVVAPLVRLPSPLRAKSAVLVKGSGPWAAAQTFLGADCLPVAPRPRPAPSLAGMNGRKTRKWCC